MKRRSSFLFLAFLLVTITTYAQSKLKLGSIFTDDMMLQQQMQAPIWGWATAGKSVTVKTSWNGKSYKATASSTGKWLVKVATPGYGGPYTITVTGGETIKLNNVLIGDVWLCGGQSNMEMFVKGFKSQVVIGSMEAILHSKNDQIRLYTVPHVSVTTEQDDSKPAQWKIAAPASVADFSGTGYFFGRLVHQLTGVPIGLISDNYGGSTVEAWMDKQVLKDFPAVKVPGINDTIRAVTRTPTTLYNGMIHPVVGYAIKGAIWYQGESNRERPDEYLTLFPAMVKRWRDLWGQGDFPFYYAQIAPYDYAQLPPYNQGGKWNSAHLRDAQRKALAFIPNSNMAVLMDLGDKQTIHPAKKKEVGERLAYLALAQTYGLKGFDAASPTFKSVTFNGDKAVINFDNANNGLTSYGKPLQYFEIAGANKTFYPATATISGSTVVLTSLAVKEPVAVRYAWQDYIVGELYGTNGLPVSSFRTDDW